MLETLLPRDALAGTRLAVSISDSPDLERLGLTQAHLHLALAEIARLVVIGGGTLAYGGDLRPGGYTQFLIDEIQRYGTQGRDTLEVYLAWPVHRKMRRQDLYDAGARLGSEGRLICLDRHGKRMDFADGRGDEPAPVEDATEVADALTAMRRTMCAASQGRMILGGKADGYTGHFPGVLEEAMLTLEAGKPLYLAAGFGGVTAAAARQLGLPMDWLEAGPEPAREDPRTTAALHRLAAAAKVHPPHNGLDESDQARLAATHRPSEIATLVSRGLGELFKPQTP